MRRTTGFGTPTRPARLPTASISAVRGWFAAQFTFVLISFAAGLGLLTGTLPGLLVAMVALSMAMAPLLMIADARLIQPRFLRGEAAKPADAIDGKGAAIIAGHGRFGMTIGRLLKANGYEVVVLDHDASQIEVLRKFGFTVFYGDATRHDLLEAAGAREAKLLIIAIDEPDKVIELIGTARKHFPHLQLFARAYDRAHVYEIMKAGVDKVYREVFGSSMDMGEDALVALGKHPYEAFRATRTFRRHDEELIRKAVEHAGDDEKLVSMAREARAEIARVLNADRVDEKAAPDHSWDATDAVNEARS